MAQTGYFKVDSDGYNPQVILPAVFMHNTTAIDMRRYLDAHGIVNPLLYRPYQVLEDDAIDLTEMLR